MTDLLSQVRTPVLVTGNAGFIGFHLAKRLLDDGYSVVGLDNLNDYYDVSLKEARLNILKGYDSFQFVKLDLGDDGDLDELFDQYRFEVIVHLAAQPGVRYSLENPQVYLHSNIIGFFNLLEAIRAKNVQHLVFASSSSVYGLNTRMPFSVHDNVDHPISLYAASKKSNELLAHVYSHLFCIPMTGLRFFTAYGPWYRPDMALFRFARAIYIGEPLTLYNDGKMKRDFTYVDDIVEGIVRVMDRVPEENGNWSGDNPDPGSSMAPYKVYNIGAGTSVEVLEFLHIIEAGMGKKAIINMSPMQAGEVPATFADISDLARDTGYKPTISIKEGVQRFLEWFMDYYGSGRPIPTG